MHFRLLGAQLRLLVATILKVKSCVWMYVEIWREDNLAVVLLYISSGRHVMMIYYMYVYITWQHLRLDGDCDSIKSCVCVCMCVLKSGFFFFFFLRERFCL